MPRESVTLGRSRLFPSFNEPESLTVLDIRPYSWDEQLTMVCTQGLVNRIKPRIYLVFDDYVDRLWLDLYHERYGITHSEVKDLFEFVRLFVGELSGFVVYDDKMLHSANVAMTFGSIHNAVPASPGVADKLSEMGLEKVADFRGVWRNRIEAYEWALANLMSDCHERIVGSMCVDPGWVQPMHNVRDYLVAAKAFCFDLSTKVRDRRENALFDRVLGRVSSLGVVLGWHCSRDLESEYVARAAKNGLFVLCNLKSPNLSVHSGIRVDGRFEQEHVDRDAVTVESKVYVAFVQSDGDAVWAMNNFQNRNWLDGQRGDFPYTWEIQPLLVELAPAMLEYYYRTATANDYLIAGPTGAGYTYPTLNKRLEEFLQQTRDFLQLCDVRSALVMNRDPRVCYEELQDPGLPLKTIGKLDTCLGFIHGYTGSAFSPTVFVGDLPWIHTTEYIDGSSDIFKEITKFGNGCSSRPLFISVHVREDTSLTTLRDAVNNLDPEVYKVVRLDEFLRALRKAREEGRFAQAFAETEFLKEGLKERGRNLWDGQYKRIVQLERIVGLESGRMLDEFRRAGYDLDEEALPDFLGYEAIETMLYLIRSALLINGVHVNYLDQSIKDFAETYADLPGVDVVEDAYELWRDWERAENGLEGMAELARRVVSLGKALRERVHDEEQTLVLRCSPPSFPQSSGHRFGEV